MELEEAHFNLETCLDESLELVRHRAERKGLDIALRYPEGSARWFRGDVTRLRQVIVNYLSNAVKFTEDGGIYVAVEVKELSAELAFLDICVVDTGMGISEEAQLKLFSAFTQADSSTTRKFGGTGLGLSISAKIANVMGGTTYVKSKPGHGSTFGLRLQLGLGAPTPANDTAPPLEEGEMATHFPHRN